MATLSLISDAALKLDVDRMIFRDYINNNNVKVYEI